MANRSTNLVNSSNSTVFLTFLAYSQATKKINLFHLDLNTITPVQGIPLDPLFSRKYEYSKQYDSNKNYLGETQGNEMVEDFNIGITVDVDMNMVERGTKTLRERISRNKLENIIKGEAFEDGGEVYKMLGIAGNVNFASRMTGNNTNKHWKYLAYRENGFVRDGVAYDKDDLKIKVMPNPLLATYNISTLGMMIEWNIANGDGQVQVVRFSLVGFNQNKLNIDTEKNTIATNLQIKSDAIQAGDLFVNGGSEEGDYYYEVKDIEFYTGTPVIPSAWTPGANYLMIDDATGEIRYIKDVSGTLTDMTPTLKQDLGTVFYCKKYETGLTAGGGTGFCDADNVVEYTPVFVAVGQYDCATKVSKAVQWLLDEATTGINKEDFLLKVKAFNGATNSFTLYDSENL